MSYQHRNWVKVTTSYPKQAKKTSVKPHFLELRRTDPRRVTMLVIHTDLAAGRERPFAALRVTWCDWSNCQAQFIQIEPCLRKASRPRWQLPRPPRHAQHAGGSVSGESSERQSAADPPNVAGFP